MKKIFVGNLDFKATEESIRSLFEQHGTVERVSLMTDRDTGRSRGFAFVGTLAQLRHQLARPAEQLPARDLRAGLQILGCASGLHREASSSSRRS